MSYLYGESSRPQKAELNRHLRGCAACQKQVAEWRGAMKSLTKWQLPSVREAFAFSAGAAKWAAAAAIVLGLGFMGGRLSSAQPGSRDLRAEIDSSVRAALAGQQRDLAGTEKELDALRSKLSEELSRSLRTTASQTLAASGEQSQTLLAAYEERQREQLELMLALIKALDARQTRLAVELAAFRNEAETMAVLTESGFQKTQQQLYQLASHTSASPGAN